MDISLLAELKRMVSFDAKLAPVWMYFMDHFADRPEFIALGERAAADNGVVRRVAGIAAQLFHDARVITNLRLVCLPEHHFVHGSFFLDGRIGGVFYFEDIEVGLVAVCAARPSIEVKYARFSDAIKRKPGDPHHN